MDLNLKTKQEIEKENKYETICSAYGDLTKKYPKASPTRKFKTLAEKFNMSDMGIRRIIIKKGLYNGSNK